MSEAKTVPAKYIFLDVVGFTQERSVEAQTDIVHTLNAIVSAAIEELEVPKDQLIFLPTGDGLCVAFLNVENPFDVHLLGALRIIKGVHEHSARVEDQMRRFQVRIGLNSNIDNLVTDINGNRNIAGAGINMASRVMSVADGNQILVGESVYDTLRYQEKYMGAFRPLPATVKHEVQISVYQLVQEGNEGLSTDQPQAARTDQETKLTKYVAYYFAHAIKNRKFFIQHNDALDVRPGIALLNFLASDSWRESEKSKLGISHCFTYKAGEAEIGEQLDYYNAIDDYVITMLSEYVLEHTLKGYEDCLEKGAWLILEARFMNQKGCEKLKSEWPEIWAEFKLDECT